MRHQGPQQRRPDAETGNDQEKSRKIVYRGSSAFLLRIRALLQLRSVVRFATSLKIPVKGSGASYAVKRVANCSARVLAIVKRC